MMPTQEELRGRFDYNPETGVLTSIRRGKSFTRTGATGYIRVRFGSKVYGAHVLIWIMMTGAAAEMQIDHRDRVRSNNKWSNLRLATSSQQRWNQGIFKNNTSGAKGVSRQRNKWRSSIKVNGKKIELGVHVSLTDAAEAYAAAARKYFGEFVCAEKSATSPIFKRKATK